MLKIVNKKFNLITIFSIALLVMGFLIVGLQLYFYFIYGSKFLDSITLIGMINLGLGYYQLFLKKARIFLNKRSNGNYSRFFFFFRDTASKIT